MTDEKIVEKYSETIKNGMNKICKENHIKDKGLKEAILHAYQKGFLEGFKEGREEERRKYEEERKKHEEEKKNLARKLLAKGMEITEVADLIGLSVREAQSLGER